jgi:hypothetical protein
MAGNPYLDNRNPELNGRSWLRKLAGTNQNVRFRLQSRHSHFAVQSSASDPKRFLADLAI